MNKTDNKKIVSTQNMNMNINEYLLIDWSLMLQV